MDSDQQLRSNLVEFKWFIDLTGEQTGIELATFEVEFQGENNLPYFKPPLQYILPVIKESDEVSWTYLLDPFDDDLGDEVSVSVDLGETSVFMSYTGDSKLEIADLNSQLITISKEYTIQVSATDGKDTVVRDITFVVFEADTTQAE